ncbi:polysaccharide biosynthesis/export family protein [Nibricoccus sp. IMCC34717]|uniref:polysaccharide biosynthesis/export family protein n=1 Tax=Nibricoccus sp. IMCC34717 TaxID=3034021 RepID=UPI00384CA910
MVVSRFIHFVIRIGFILGVACSICHGERKGSSSAESYRLQPMDLLRVQVFQELDLDRDVRVSRNYTVTLPLIGSVDLRGKSILEAEKLVTALYRRDYLVNPQVNVTVIEYSPRSVNVLGAVNAPGQVVIPPETTLSLLDAISRSGGFSRLANRTRVVVTRTETDGTSANYVVNADDLMVGNSNERWTLQPSDVVFVPESIL